MRSVDQIAALLPELDHRIADELEDQDLDFKQWDTQSRDKSVQTVVRMAVCMANGGGGTVVFGVADQVKGRDLAILGMPMEIDINILKKAVYDQTDPKIMPVFEELNVPEGTGRLLLMQIHPGMPPYTDTSGRGTIRIGRDCQPLTGTLRRKIAVETGETDFSAEIVRADLQAVLSPTAMECLRSLAKAENAPDDLLRMDDKELLQALGVLPNGNLTKAALLLCGSEDAIRKYIPSHHWLFLHMRSDIEYDIREDRVSAIPISVARLEELLLPFNPITTVERGLYHFEYRTYPAIAFRESLMNAFSHADYRIAGPVMVKMFSDNLTISNNGGFIAGITARNILHHQPAARNPLLVEALTRLRLINRSNLGVARMFSAFLVEGKMPPIIEEIGESIAVTFRHSEMDAEFRMLIAEIQAPPLTVDELLALTFLRRNPLADVVNIAEVCSCSPDKAFEILRNLTERKLAESSGQDGTLLWRLAGSIRKKYPALQAGFDNRKFVLQFLRSNLKTGLPISTIIDETAIPRTSLKRLLAQLRKEGLARVEGKGPSARWIYVGTK